MSLLRRYWWVLPLLVGVLAGVGIAVSPRTQDAVQQATGTGAVATCGPAPCAAPDGFEVDVLSVQTANGNAVLQVGFKNNTPEGFGAGNYRPTSPKDFQLQIGFGRRSDPVFSADCPDWGEIHVVRGSTAGPEPLCFKASSTSGTQLVWSPDLGILFHEVRIQLGA